MKVIIVSGALCATLITPLAMADKTYTSGELKSSVIELYTSEGCSSCPPADEFLSKLGKTKEADKIIPLAFHVDYWDYIGWEDPYAKAKYTQRQRVLAKVNKQSSIYTPEFVVDGAEARGSRKITKQLKNTYQQTSEADITLNLSDDAQSVTADVLVNNITYQGDEAPQVFVAIYENGLSSNIDAGENNGRTLKHDYVVRYLSQAEKINDGGMHQFKLAIDSSWNRDELGISVIVKLSESGRTLQALKGMLL